MMRKIGIGIDPNIECASKIGSFDPDSIKIRIVAAFIVGLRYFQEPVKQAGMKIYPFKRPYLVAALFFLALIVIGGWVWQWRETELSYLVLLYLVVIVGIRLDHISDQLDQLDQKVDNMSARCLQKASVHEFDEPS